MIDYFLVDVIGRVCDYVYREMVDCMIYYLVVDGIERVMCIVR